MHVPFEEQFAANVSAIAEDAERRGLLAELLREEHPVYDGRSTAATNRMRGWILSALSRVGVTDDELVFVLDELGTGMDPYTVAAAARALRSYPRPSASFVPLVMRALGNIRYRDEPVSFDTYGTYASSSTGTTPVGELLETLVWLRPHARGVLPDLEALRTERLARKYALQMDRAIAAIRCAAPVEDDCCTLPFAISWPRGSRKGSEPVGSVVFEDHDGARLTFEELFRGQPSIVVFFYTRCNNPLKCSLSIAKLARIQQLLAARGLDDQVRTAAITYDPGFDTSDRLRTYGRDRDVRLDARNRILRTVGDLGPLRRHFNLGVNFVQSVVNRHQIEVHVLDRNGAIAASFKRLRWDEEDVVQSAGAALMEKPTRTTLPVIGTLAAFAVALFPKCPMCWAAYLSMFGIAGVQQLHWAPWLQSVLALLVLTNVFSVWLRSRAMGRPPAFYLVAAGALSIAFSSALGGAKVAAFAGVALTIAGSLVSAWRSPGRAATQ